MSVTSRLQRTVAVALSFSLFFATIALFPTTADAQDESTTVRDVAHQIGAAPLYAEGLTGAGIDVAVIDTGVEPVPGLDGDQKVIVGPDLSFEAGVEAFYGHDTFGHGTVMASIIAGDDGPDGFQGVAPGSRILSVKVADNTGAVDVSQVIAALDWVVQNGQTNGLNVRVINLAYVTDSDQSYEIDPLAHAVERAWRAGYVVVVPAGNDGEETAMLGNPAADPYVIAVAAADDTGTAGFSSHGSATRMPDVLAPGHRILGLAAPNSRLVQNHPDAVIDDRFLRGSGTSQATAVVAGAAALLLEQRPELTPDQVKALLILGVVDEDGKGRSASMEATSGVAHYFDLRDLEADYRALATGLFTEAGEVRTLNGNRNGRKAHLLEAQAEDLLLAADGAREDADRLRDEVRAHLDRDGTQADMRANAALDEQVDAIFANWSGTQLGSIDYDPQSGAGLIDVERSAALPAFDAVQHHAPSNGSGSLEASRGSNHVTLPDGTRLEGEQTWTWFHLDWFHLDWFHLDWFHLDWFHLDWFYLDWFHLDWFYLDWLHLDWLHLDWLHLDWLHLDWFHLDRFYLDRLHLDWLNLDWLHLDWLNLDRLNLVVTQVADRFAAKRLKSVQSTDFSKSSYS